ncbi:MAG TPA: nuclear transport factor 2 family protein [Anaerolineae bacterium]|nr:nuclear transport factor 2 family protein [Anaerolineae bacterium]HID85066.1 hypothetical protein [Anaerolineales bacterium]HIQ08677.1 hypothetical protein [Anaerolineaceae bacterium]
MSERRAFLLGSGIVVLFAVVAGVLFARRRPPTYPPDDPRRVVQAYLQALEQRNYQRAYDYWAPQAWLDAQKFEHHLQETASWRQQYAVSIGAVRFPGPDRAVVLLHLTRIASPPLLFPAEEQVLEAVLTRTDGSWRLVALPPPWGVVEGLKRLPPPPAPPSPTPGE